MTCTFFGHRDTDESVRSVLRAAIVHLIEEKGVTTFYFGNQGAFDRIVCGELRQLQKIYSQIRCIEVLAYYPEKNATGEFETVYPEQVARAPRRYAISYRNRWMLKHSEYVIVYVIGSVGGAAQFAMLAEKKGKEVLNLAEATLRRFSE